MTPCARAVAFDLDGTLIDSTEAIVASFMHTFDVIGEPRPARQAILDTVGYITEEQFTRLTRQDPAACAAIYKAKYEDLMLSHTTLHPGVEESLELLRDADVPMGFATSKERAYSEAILDHLGILHYFASRIGPEDVEAPKPHPSAALESAARLGAPAARLFFVGDSHFDVRCAQAAGARAIAVSTGYHTWDELAALEPEALFGGVPETVSYILEQTGKPEPAAARRA